MNKKNHFSQINNEASKARRKGKVAVSLNADCLLDSYYATLVELIIQPESGRRGDFWDFASRVVIKAALKKYAAQRKYAAPYTLDVEKFYAFLKSAAAKEYENFFKGTEAALYTLKRDPLLSLATRMVTQARIESYFWSCRPVDPRLALLGSEKLAQKTPFKHWRKNHEHEKQKK